MNNLSDNKHSAFWDAFFDGLSGAGLYKAPSTQLLPLRDISYKSGVHGNTDIIAPSATDAMRGDWENIGMDFRRVMQREAPNHPA